MSLPTTAVSPLGLSGAWRRRVASSCGRRGRRRALPLYAWSGKGRLTPRGWAGRPCRRGGRRRGRERKRVRSFSISSISIPSISHLPRSSRRSRRSPCPSRACAALPASSAHWKLSCASAGGRSRAPGSRAGTCGGRRAMARERGQRRGALPPSMEEEKRLLLLLW